VARSSEVRRSSSRAAGGSRLFFLRRLRTPVNPKSLAAANRLSLSPGRPAVDGRPAGRPVSIPTKAQYEKHGPLQVPRLGCTAGSFGPVENFSRKR
jgi:hypothetical protein